MSQSSYPVTNSHHVRGDHPPDEYLDAPSANVSPVARQVTAVLVATGVVPAALFIAIVVLAQSQAPSWSSVAVAIAVAGAVVAVVGIAISVWLVGRTRSLPAPTPTPAPASVPMPQSESELAGDLVIHDGADAASPQYPQVLRTLSLRLQSLNGKTINQIQALEEQLDDPFLLKLVFGIDHLATRTRRQAENLAVIGGTVLQHRKSPPLPVAGVLRAAVAETEHYPQIMIVEAADAHVRGYAVAEVIHLLAELMENATTFTSPQSPKVVVRATVVTSGVAIDIEDRGIGIPPDRLRLLNALLDGSLDVELGDVVSESRIGLTVVRYLATRHGIRAKLQTNMYGGINAAVVLPSTLLVTSEQMAEPERRMPSPSPREVHRPQRQLRPEPQPTLVTPAYDTTPPGRHAAYASLSPSSPVDTGTQRAIAAAPQSEPLPRRIPATAAAEPPPITGNLEATPPMADQAPALPQRNGSHLHPELLAPPANHEPTGVHNPNLLADIRNGRRRLDAEEASSSTGPLPKIFQTEGQHH